MKYRLLEDRFEHTANTIVYDCVHPDYGLSYDDTCATGIEHISVTLNEDGSYPYFTVPVDYLSEVIEAVKEKPAPFTGTVKATYKCTDCGHEQSVTEIHTENGVYVGSGANWCDACGDGKPERKEKP